VITQTHAYVFMKPLAASKSRLAGALTPARRELLAASMLASTLDAVTDAGLATTVIGGDPDVRQLSEASGAAWRPEPVAGLNESLSAVIVAALSSHVLYLPADLPLLTPEDIETLLSSAGEDTVVIAPDRWRLGTNALLLPAASAFVPALGQGSFELHMAEAQRLGLTPRIVETPGLGFDVDTPADLGLLLQRRSGWWQDAAAVLLEASVCV
jgi:2-phospho-L-lactate guanylyltransferase